MEQIFDVLSRLRQALHEAGIEYRLVGGLAVFLHISERDPLAARMTRDVDVAVDRADLSRIVEAVKPFGFEYRHAAGVDMLVDSQNPKARSAVHFVFLREKVRPEYLGAVPDFSTPVRGMAGTLLASIEDLVRMKLTSYHLKDRTHIIDMDGVGLITPEIEARLPDELRRRLAETRAAG